MSHIVKEKLVCNLSLRKSDKTEKKYKNTNKNKLGTIIKGNFKKSCKDSLKTFNKLFFPTIVKLKDDL